MKSTSKGAFISIEIFAYDLPSFHSPRTHLEFHYFLTQLLLEVGKGKTVVWLAGKSEISLLHPEAAVISVFGELSS